MNIRVGFGYDVHKLVVDRDLWLGGIKIDYELGLLGHSDADVLILAMPCWAPPTCVISDIISRIRQQRH